MNMMSTNSMTINGKLVTHEAPLNMHLGDFLRHVAGLTGTHIGCEHGACGVCTILVDGQPVRACLMLAVQANGATIETVEGLGKDGKLSSLQQAFRDHHALQCGFCTPGMLMTLVAFLRQVPRPNEAQVREAISGNICRCTGYQGIIEAVLAVTGGSKL